MSNQRLMKVKEKAGDGYAKTNAIAPAAPPGKRGSAGLEPDALRCDGDTVRTPDDSSRTARRVASSWARPHGAS